MVRRDRQDQGLRPEPKALGERRAEDFVESLDAEVLAMVASGQLDLNEMALRELERRVAHGTQLELEFDDIPLLLQHQAC